MVVTLLLRFFSREKSLSLINLDEIFSHVEDHANELILPDQDVFNSLYGMHTKPIDDRIWNYDVRYYYAYLIKSEGMCTTKWVTKNTRIIHFFGKAKPWCDDYANRFGLLYQHNVNLEELARKEGYCYQYNDSICRSLYIHW